jgi:hypothetical protein
MRYIALGKNQQKHINQIEKILVIEQIGGTLQYSTALVYD